MTKRDFFRLVFKLFALYSLVLSCFSFLPSILGYIAYLDVFGYVYLGASILFMVLFFLFLLYRSDIIITKLKLAEGFDEDRIQFENLKEESVIKLAIILLGAFLIIDNLPALLALLYKALEFDIAGINFGDNFGWQAGIAVLNLLLGYLLIANFRPLSHWLNRAEE